MRKVFVLFLFTLLALSCLPLRGQLLSCEKQLISTAWHNTGQILKAPAHYKLKHWAMVGVGIGATALAFNFDDAWQAEITKRENSFANSMATYVGEPFGNPIYMGGFLALNYALACRLENEKWTQLSSQALQSIVLASGITLVLKAGFHRHRPEEQNQLDPYQFDGPSFRRENLSFPSGHTTVAFALASSVSAFYNNKWYIAVPAFTLAGVSGWSRIYQQKHWPSDVVLGALIGTAVGYTLHNINKPQKNKVSFSIAPNLNGGASLGASFRLN